MKSKDAFIEWAESARQCLETYRAENARVDAMLQQVRSWQPPTHKHQGLKDFMLEQLQMSKSDTSYTERDLSRAEAREPISYYDAALSEADRSIAYYKQELDKEKQRANGNNLWVKKLRESLRPR